MECPSCGAEARDPEAIFCARCGTRLKRDEAHAERTTDTESTEDSAPPPEEQGVVSSRQTPPSYDPGPAPRPPEPPAEGAVTAQQRPGPDRPSIESPYGGYQGEGSIHQPDTTEQPPPPGESKGATVPVREFAVALQRSFVSGRWGQFAGAAAIGWLTMVGLGALIVAAAAIGSGGFGPGIDALDVLSLIVLFGLSIMGVSLEFSNLGPVGPSFSMVWLGALAILGYALSWATARAVAQRGLHSARGLAIEGAKVAVPFALYCLLAALLFKITDVGTLSASAPQALFLGLLWGVVFGALGGLRSWEPLAAVWGRVLEGVKTRRRSAYEGVAAAGVMLGTTALASAAAFLVTIIIALARGDSLDELTIGSVIAALIVLTLTLPNVLSLIASVSLGAPLTLFTDALGARESISIIGFGGRTSGSLVLLFLFIPLLSCLLGGFSAYRQSIDRSKMTEVLFTASCVYAGALATMALLNGFSFEGGVEGVNVGVVSSNFLLVALLGLVWSALFGFGGWKLAEMQDPDTSRESSPPDAHPQPQGHAPPGYNQEPLRRSPGPDEPAPPTTEHRGPPSDR